MATEMAASVPESLEYLYAAVNASYNLSWLPEPVRDWVVEAGVEYALDWTLAATAASTPAHWAQALKGLSDGSGVDIVSLQRVTMIAEWTRASCSMLGAWGSASANGGLVQLRALDWDTDGPFQKWPILVVYHPSGNVTQQSTSPSFANAQLGWVGMLGAITGVSAAGVGISEKVWDAYKGSWNPFGYPWNLMLADALMFDSDADAVLSRLATANRTCAIWIGVGDAHGNGGGGSFKAVAYSHDSLTIFNDANFPVYPNHDRYKDLLFINKHVQPSSEPCMNDLMKWGYGAFDASVVAAVTALEATGDMHVAIFDFGHDILLVSNASPDATQLAYQAPFVSFSMSTLLTHQLPAADGKSN